MPDGDIPTPSGVQMPAGDEGTSGMSGIEEETPAPGPAPMPAVPEVSGADSRHPVPVPTVRAASEVPKTTTVN